MLSHCRLSATPYRRLHFSCSDPRAPQATLGPPPSSPTHSHTPAPCPPGPVHYSYVTTKSSLPARVHRNTPLLPRARGRNPPHEDHTRAASPKNSFRAPSPQFPAQIPHPLSSPSSHSHCSAVADQSSSRTPAQLQRSASPLCPPRINIAARPTDRMANRRSDSRRTPGAAHIMYHLLKAATNAERDAWSLGLGTTAKDFRHTNGESGAGDRRRHPAWADAQHIPRRSA